MTRQTLDSLVASPGEEATRPFLRLDGIGMSFPTKEGAPGTLVIDGLSFDIDEGQFCSIVGPSGCGKSTALRIIDGLQPPSTGQVMIDGQVVRKPSLDIGFVFQHYNLLPWRTVGDNVALSLEVLGVDRKARAERASRWLELVGLRGYEDHFPAQLSGGMQQRVGLARALALEPRLLLMDEPFGALDAQTRVLLQEQLVKIWESRRATVVFVTHDIEEALFLSDRVLVMAANPGRVVADIAVDFPRPRDHALRADARLAEMKAEIWDLLHPGLHQ